MQYKHFTHNIFNLVPEAWLQQPAAGPSRPRASLPSRQTRRQAHEQTDHFSITSTPAVESPAAKTVQTSNKSRTSEVGTGEVPVEEDIQSDVGSSTAGSRPLKGKGKGKMLPPPIPDVKGRGRRQTIGPVMSIVDGHDELDQIASKGGKRSRASLPNLDESVKKRGPGRPPKNAHKGEAPSDVELDPVPPKRKPGRPPKALLLEKHVPSPSPIESPSIPPEPPVERSPTPPPAPLPSLAHLEFTRPPRRSYPRKPGPSRMIYTDPDQPLVPDLKFGGSLSAFLQSYTQLDEGAPSVDIKVLETRAEKEGFYYNRVNWLQSQGRLQRDEDEDVPASAKAVNKAHVAARQQDHRDALMSHMTQVRNAMLAEAKGKPIVCRRIARMIAAHWEHIEGREERERLKEEREMKRRAKELVKAIRKKWSLAVKVSTWRLIPTRLTPDAFR